MIRGRLNCAICQERIHPKAFVQKTICNHKFHAHCYLIYLDNSKVIKCPLCRTELGTQNKPDFEHMESNFAFAMDYDSDDDSSETS